MRLHLDRENFKAIINKISLENNIDEDILEKDYYVCCILKQLSYIQNDLKAYFKGGTALYKIIDTMNRFSEDIDLTVEELEQSNRQNKIRLKKSALSYDIQGLTLIDRDIHEKNITGVYEYNTVCNITDRELYRAGKIQVESTSFTVSEPTDIYYIEPLLYKLADNSVKKVFREQFDVTGFNIRIIKLERIFIDKVFAAEFYNIEKSYIDMAKHIYDICVLLENEKIKVLLEDKDKLNLMIQYKRKEEAVRRKGIDSNTKIKNFEYLNCSFSEEFKEKFYLMQQKYILNDKYTFKFEDVFIKLTKLKKIAEKYNF